MRYLEVVDKVIETGGIRMIIGEILCLYSYIDCPLLTYPPMFWSQPRIDKYPTNYVR